MIKAGIIGATGYAGNELVRLLSNHRETEIVTITSQSYVGKPLSDVYYNYLDITDLNCEAEDIEKMADACDVIFLALPHGVTSEKVTAKLLEKTKVIDLGADFRFKDIDTYEKWYVEHKGKDLVSEAVYGLCEINRDKIKNSRLVGNPGCYTTCSILALYPLVKEGVINLESIIIDAKSGTTGAGRSANLGSLYCEVNESIKAYKIGSHRHMPEIEEQLSFAAGKKINLIFTPHLVPMNRGILATSYAKLNKPMSYEQIQDIYMKYYADEHFVRIVKQNNFPETKWVKASNFCDIGFTVDEHTGTVIVVSALDNLVKGAAGQAVQNMNIMFGLDEKMGLEGIPVFPA
jgi:N-acetyl-gamma-glutamyl-phosphate reductase